MIGQKASMWLIDLESFLGTVWRRDNYLRKTG
jgi:hypothetical protein